MAKRKTYRRRLRRVRRNRVCMFCKQEIKPDYKEVDILKKFVSDRGKIYPRLESGVCQKHQRMLAKEVKKARFLAFLPFIVRPE